jgi:hypothetical protein
MPAKRPVPSDIARDLQEWIHHREQVESMIHSLVKKAISKGASKTQIAETMGTDPHHVDRILNSRQS